MDRLLLTFGPRRRVEYVEDQGQVMALQTRSRLVTTLTFGKVYSQGDVRTYSIMHEGIIPGMVMRASQPQEKS